VLEVTRRELVPLAHVVAGAYSSFRSFPAVKIGLFSPLQNSQMRHASISRVH
jgi:hypothetical protein